MIKVSLEIQKFYSLLNKRIHGVRALFVWQGCVEIMSFCWIFNYELKSLDVCITFHSWIWIKFYVNFLPSGCSPSIIFALMYIKHELAINSYYYWIHWRNWLNCLYYNTIVRQPHRIHLASLLFQVGERISINSSQKHFISRFALKLKHSNIYLSVLYNLQIWFRVYDSSNLLQQQKKRLAGLGG